MAADAALAVFSRMKAVVVTALQYATGIALRLNCVIFTTPYAILYRFVEDMPILKGCKTQRFRETQG
jgi:hypothetical protein